MGNSNTKKPQEMRDSFNHLAKSNSNTTKPQEMRYEMYDPSKDPSKRGNESYRSELCRPKLVSATSTQVNTSSPFATAPHTRNVNYNIQSNSNTTKPQEMRYEIYDPSKDPSKRGNELYRSELCRPKLVSATSTQVNTSSSFATASHTRNVNYNIQNNSNTTKQYPDIPFEVGCDASKVKYASYKPVPATSTQMNTSTPLSTTSNTRSVNDNVQNNVNLASKVQYNYCGLPSEKRTQDLSQDLRFNHAVNHTINAKVATMTDDKEKSLCYNDDLTKKKNETAVSPPKILTQDDFMTKWFSWKETFLTYMKAIDPMEKNKDKWCMMLLNRMGPAGQEIYKTFTFEDSSEKEDINKLLKKFDMFCVFGNVTRENADETDKYVNALIVMASKYMTETDKIVKEKILMEIDEAKFRQKVGSLIQGFSYPSGVEWLTVREMAYIWMSYEDFDFKREEKIFHNQVKNCRNCGDTHALNRCRAHGKSCIKCGIDNHFFYRCPSQYFTECKWCGEGHFLRQCPAYGNECHKCLKLNHFSWKCMFHKLLQCKFCKVMHYASKPCPLRNY